MDKDLVINNFQRGLGDTPYTGFGRIQNLEIYETKGILKLKKRLTTNPFGLTPGALPIACVYDVYGNVYTATEADGSGTSYVYKNGTTIQSRGGVVYDLKVWNNYLFITRSTSIDVYGPLTSGGAQVFTNWQTINGQYGAPIFPLIATMYVGNGNYVAVISSFAEQPAGTPPTATFNSTAVTLKSGEYCRTLNGLGRTVLIGTFSGSSFYDMNVGSATIRPYDIGTLLLGDPINFSEHGINQIFVYNNQAYVQAGKYGNIYVTNGSSVQFFKKLPLNLTGSTTIFPYPNAINYINNQLLIGTSTLTDSFPTKTQNGIYSISGGSTSFQTISTLNTGANQNLKIGVIYPVSQSSMYVGWQDGTTCGLDYVDNSTYGSSSGVLESEVIKVGTILSPKTYQHLEVQLTKPLTANQSISIYWREGVNGTNKLIKTFDSTTTDGIVTSLYAKALITNAITMQLVIVLNQTGAALNTNNIEIMEVRLS